MARKKLTEAVSQAVKGNFDLESFKSSKNLSNSSVTFKDQKWIPLSAAFQDTLSLPGIPMGHITLLRGHSDTGKTTALIEAAVSAQKMGILPVFIITEMKWNWDHARTMGFEMEEVVDESTGEVLDYKGFFIYVDRGSLHTIEDVAGFIADLLDEQKKGRLPHDLLFLWDSVGSVPSRMSVESNKNNPQWNAGAMSQQFANFINQKVILSRKSNSPYTNSLVAVNKIWVSPAETPMSQPKMRNKGGDSMFFDASLIVTFGNVTNSGTTKIKATKNGKDVEFAKRTRIMCDKNHITGITTKGTVTVTVHGFISDDPKEIEKYKKDHKHEWLNVLGAGDFTIVEDKSDWEESTKSIPMIGEEDFD
jgi:hypothetical protein